MAASKPKAPAAPKAAAPGEVRVYPTHRRSAGPLVVGLPAVDGNSPELVIDDDGVDVPKALAEHLIGIGEASEKPAQAEA